MDRNLKKDYSLLSLEKKLENDSTHDIIMNKFKLKPDMHIESYKNKGYLKDLNNFLESFKKSTEELINNPGLIEQNKIENTNNDQGQMIKMNLALGVLDIKEIEGNKINNDQDRLIKSVIKNKNNIEEEGINTLIKDNLDKSILLFLANNKQKKKRRRIRKIKK